MNRDESDAEMALRQWFADHEALQWPPAVAFDAERLFAAVAARPVGRRAGGRFAGWLAAAVVVAGVAWVALAPPAPVVRVPARLAVAPQRPSSPVAVGALTEMDMMGVNGGWVLTTGGQVLRTTSGGRRWTPVTPPSLRTVPPTEPIQFSALSMEAAWIAVDAPHRAVTVFRTTDGGRTWSQSRIAPIAFGGGGVQMDFVAGGHGWLEVLTAGNASPSAALYATSDGGRTWSLLSTSTAASRRHVPFGGLLTFLTPAVGWTVGAPRAAGQVPWRYYVAATTDGGVLWRRVTLPQPPAVAGVAVNAITILRPQATGPSHVLLPVIYGQQGGPEQLVLYAWDGGRAGWHVAGALAVSAWVGTSEGINAAQVSFVSTSTGFAALNGRVYRTTDGGRTWSLRLASPQVTAWTAMTFVSPRAGWALDGAGHLWATVDGGRTWRAVTR